ncbi:hypothetical protein QM012_002530 [Aureobasidium pullulans]|uniref:Periplasmic binding protein-like II n=1 Tax=Aureobasidium pullulans TaxID=5580 RepID=A0ABR0TC80_AURPU
MKIHGFAAFLALSSPVLCASLRQPGHFHFPSKYVAIETRSLDEIYAAAKNETGELIVLWGGDAVSQGDATVAAWRARFPDIKLNLTPLGWDKIYSAIKDPDGAFLGTYIYQFGNFIFNKHLLNVSDIPDTYEDLVDPA